MPDSLSMMSSGSATTPGNSTVLVLQTRGAARATTRSPPPSATSPDSSWSRKAAIRAGCSLSASRAASAATPMPTMPATFSVPPRRSRSCPPPATSGRRRTQSATNNAPTPLGPWNLCAAMLTRSATPQSSATGSFPTDCTASTWTRARRRRAIFASSRTSSTPPVSLFTCVTDTSATESSRLAANSATSSFPSASTRMRRTSTPSCSNSFAAASTAGFWSDGSRSMPMARAMPARRARG